MAFDRITVIGAGAWGTALANVCARAGRDVTLWARDPAAACQLSETRETSRLPGVRLEERVFVSAQQSGTMAADAILVAVPAQAMRAAVTALAPRITPDVPVIACAKGIEQGSRAFMTDVIAAAAPQATPAILSGPSFASDVARGLPTAVTLAVGDPAIGEQLARALSSSTFRTYHATDIRGVEIGGAAKNVLAIAAGIVAGHGLGASAAAALTTRGFAELIRFGKAYGARAETLTGLSGLGDLILTCSSVQSRNYSFGLMLGQGRPPDDALGAIGLVEGASTADVLVQMAAEQAVDMPIAAAVAAVLGKKITIDEAIGSLLTRPVKAEV